MAQASNQGTTYSRPDLRKEALAAVRTKACRVGGLHPLRLRDYGLFIPRSGDAVHLIVHAECRDHGTVEQIKHLL